MTRKAIRFEVEVRCRFDNPEDAYQVLPFLRLCLRHQVSWSGIFFGLEFFRSGKLLRITDVVKDNDTQYYIEWKGPDTGKFANIRQEITENITKGSADCTILSMLGGSQNIQNKNEAVKELERLGHSRFMSWTGVDLSGFYKPYDIKVKMMHCEILKWPWLVEIEKMAATKEKAIQCENELSEICEQLQLQEYLVTEEPPSLLYTKSFVNNPETESG